MAIKNLVEINLGILVSLEPALQGLGNNYLRIKTMEVAV
jgi:hypothetical protein